MRKRTVGVVLMLALTACGGEASDRVAVPGAPAGGDTRPTVTVATSASSPTSTTPQSTTTAPARSSTTTAPAGSTTTAAPGATPSTTGLAPATTAGPTTTPATTTTVLVYSPEPADGPLRVGMEGPRSLLVQQQLIALAILPSTAADSKYGPGTASGVRRFQESKGLVVDGVAGPNTVAALEAAVAAAAPTTTEA